MTQQINAPNDIYRTLPLIFSFGPSQGKDITNSKCRIFCQVINTIIVQIIIPVGYLIRINTEYVIGIAWDCINDSIPCQTTTLILILFPTNSSKCCCYIGICINSSIVVFVIDAWWSVTVYHPCTHTHSFRDRHTFTLTSKWMMHPMACHTHFHLLQ
jgi:hypothetical protein